MNNVLGTGALSLGFVAAIAATGWWILGVRHARLRPRARRLTVAMAVSAAIACGVLVYALVTHDFSVRYVAENGGRAVPLYYTVISLWAALEGSLLLWLLVLSGYAVLVMRHVHPRAAVLHPWAMAVICGVAVFFFGLALFAGNAFQPVSPVPADGPGPNPLLQDHPLMGVHPPLLYLGYVGLTVPFAYAVAALITGRTGRGWLVATRRWTLAAWTFLTAGIMLGGWWSYEVLGWGGYWAWDPVENASILPWFTTTALLHSVMVQERRATLRVWNLSLAASTFLLVILGTFLTRSGVVASVHAFSQSAIGPALLGFFTVVLVGVLALLVWRSERLGPVGYADPSAASVPPAMRTRPFSEETQRALDEEVARLLRDAEGCALETLRQHRSALDELVERLLEEETLDGDVVYELVGREVPRPPELVDGDGARPEAGDDPAGDA